jgi:hypothetical protein
MFNRAVFTVLFFQQIIEVNQMKNLSLLFALLFFFSLNSYSQVSNLKVNGSSSNFTIASGDLFGWSFDVPHPGDTTLVVIWIDADQNGILNPSMDVVWTFFNQIDGDPNGQGGPPDIDGVADGHVSFQQNLGLAPAHYIMTFKNHDNVQSIAGTITNLASPTFTISGTVKVPDGYSKANIVISLESKGDNGPKGFWNAITDVNGNYSIKTNSDTSGNPHSIKPNNIPVFGSALISPEGYSVVLTPGTSSYTGNNFTVTAASASINGIVKDEFGKPVITEVQANTSSNMNFSRRIPTDQNGAFHVGFLSSELPMTNIFVGSSLSNDNQNDTVYVTGFFGVSSLKSGDAVNHDITIFKTNSTISGRVTFEGNSPNMNIQVICMNTDTGFVFAYTDINGYYVAHVSNKIYNYSIGIQQNNLPPGYVSSSIQVHPGQTNANLNITLSDVKSDNSSPKSFNLSQNYPNPFNPSTSISYQLPSDAYVTLKIFNVLGNEVKTLTNGFTQAGSHQVQFNANELSSGVYFYTIKAVSLNGKQFQSTKKMILMK